LEVIDTLALPFLALCLVIYTTVMGWLIFRSERIPSHIETTKPRDPRRRPRPKPL